MWLCPSDEVWARVLWKLLGRRCAGWLFFGLCICLLVCVLVGVGWLWSNGGGNRVFFVRYGCSLYVR